MKLKRKNFEHNRASNHDDNIVIKKKTEEKSAEFIFKKKLLRINYYNLGKFVCQVD